MARGAKATIRANVRASKVKRTSRPRTSRASTQNAGLRLMTGAQTGFDHTR